LGGLLFLQELGNSDFDWRDLEFSHLDIRSRTFLVVFGLGCRFVDQMSFHSFETILQELFLSSLHQKFLLQQLLLEIEVLLFEFEVLDL
jgi:hypothetical protein